MRSYLTRATNHYEDLHLSYGVSLKFELRKDFQAIFWHYNTRGVGLYWNVKTWWPIFKSMYYDGQQNSIQLGPIHIYWVSL